MIGLHRKDHKENSPKGKGEPAIDAKELQTRLELLYDVALKAGSVSEVSGLIEQILSITQDMLKGSASSLLIVGEAKSEMYFQAVGGMAGNLLKHKTLDLNSGIAGWVARNHKPLVINDVYEDKRFNKDLDKVTNFVTRSVIAAPIIRGKKTIGVLEVLNKTDDAEFDERDLAILTGFASTEALILLVSMAHIAINNITAHDRLIDGYKRTAEALAQATDVKDAYALGHSQRVREYTVLVANMLSLPPDELQAIEFGALLHDIGKTGIDESILRKPSPLTDEEWAVMRQHSEIGANIVGEIPFLEKTKDIVLHHHERYDGRGYPKGLQGEHIPIGARLVAVSDAFDTMTTERSYRAASTVDEAIKELVAGSGTQFCPVAVKAFVAAMKKGDVPPAKVEADHTVTPEAGLPQEKPGVPGGGDGDTIAADSELLEGEIELTLSNVDSIEPVKRLKKVLQTTENLRILTAGWSEDKGHSIVVLLREPVPLLAIINRIPVVETAYLKGKKVEVVLKPPPAG